MMAERHETASALRMAWLIKEMGDFSIRVEDQGAGVHRAFRYKATVTCRDRAGVKCVHRAQTASCPAEASRASLEYAYRKVQGKDG